MSLVVAWLVAPAVLGFVCLGCAFALERLAGTRVSGALLLPTGLAVVIVIAQALTASDATAQLATPATGAVAVAGLIAGRRDVGRLPLPALAAAGVVLLAYGAPVLATGTATFAGYIKLDDTATWLAFVDHVMRHGRDLELLAPSTFETTLAFNLPGGYPLGGFVGLGVLHELLSVDAAWLYQPFEAYAAAMLAMALYALTEGAIRGTVPRVLIAAVAAQPATLYAYVQWGGIKEIVTAALLALVAAHAVRLHADEAGPRAVLPLAICASAVLATLSVGAVVWVAPLVLPAVLHARRLERRAPWRAVRWVRAAALLALVTVSSIPVIVLAPEFIRPLFVDGPGGGGVFTSQEELGNLIAALNPLQIAGIWPAGDFRIDPTHRTVARLLIAVAIAGALVGLALAWRSGDRGVPTYAAGTILVGAAILTRGSPWVDAKSLAQASPAVVFAALSGAALLGQRARGRSPAAVPLGLAAAALAALVGGGVLWSNALAFRDANLAPRDQLRELEHIGHLAAGEGPTLMTEYSPFGARHFLREADAESASELRRRTIPLRSGEQVQKGAAADVDSFDPVALHEYRSLVLRRTPTGSRPPSAYRLTWSGRHYELWQRAPDAPPPRERLSLGDAVRPGARPSCRQVMRLADEAGPAGRLATVRRLPTVPVGLALEAIPAGWFVTPGELQMIFPTGSGTVRGAMGLSRRGRFTAWLGGSVRGRMTLSIDDREVASVRHVLNYAGTYAQLGRVTLDAGLHEVTLRYDAGGLHPGAGGQQVNPFPFGPLVLARQTAALGVTVVRPSAARTLCGQRLDWIEVLPG